MATSKGWSIDWIVIDGFCGIDNRVFFIVRQRKQEAISCVVIAVIASAGPRWYSESSDYLPKVCPTYDESVWDSIAFSMKLPCAEMVL